MLKITEQTLSEYWRKCYDYDIYYAGFPKHTSLLASEVIELLNLMHQDNEITQETLTKYKQFYEQLRDKTKDYQY